jgi:hypothetical protein
MEEKNKSKFNKMSVKELQEMLEGTGFEIAMICKTTLETKTNKD